MNLWESSRFVLHVAAFEKQLSCESKELSILSCFKKALMVNLYD